MAAADASPSKKTKLDEVDPDAHLAEFMSKQIDRSGKPYGDSKSSYFGQYKLILTEAEIAAGVQKVADYLNCNFVGEKIVLCGILKGAFIFVCDLCRRLTRPYSIYFVEASSYAGQQQGDVEVLSKIVPSKFEGRRVILIDELLDKGETMHKLSGHLMKVLDIPRERITTCVIFDKKVPGRPAEFNADIVGFRDLPPLWLVGYGLDDDGTKRGWTELVAVPKADGVPLEEDDVVFEDSAAARAKLAEIRRALLKQLE
eukprot:CAMPEP_0182927486 /NCGR_PEP_ID=MMETSP0105_2-20130417/13814_1 /TAXON_ID=81532 ORGANISM="Acanthoeca-like sp., Strain 10tr" /NCGR_SAMPLE_ID=MMETSP0105_2 /ASSEMBLY_ACC=CAM_ASM_000205 /LENGTH=256 /DNA_ID=CAMNT_0025065435 /DNA_START=41 /DNA_END=811 /DNA_ORIENTATION=-